MLDYSLFSFSLICMSLMAWHLASVIHSFSLLTCKCKVKKTETIYIFWGEMHVFEHSMCQLPPAAPRPPAAWPSPGRGCPSPPSPARGWSVHAKVEHVLHIAYLGIKFTSASSPPTWSPPSYPSTGGAAAAQAAAAASSERLRSSLSLAAASSASTCRWRAAALSEGLRTLF